MIDENIPASTTEPGLDEGQDSGYDLNSVLSEIVNTDSQNSSDEDGEEEGSESSESSDADTSQPVNSLSQRKSKNGYQERIQQLIEQRNTANMKADALQERLNYANERVKDLEAALKAYEEAFKEFEAFKAGGDTTISQPATDSPAAKANDKPLTLEEIKAALRAEEEEKRKAEQKAKDAQAYKQLWEPHIKRIAGGEFNENYREFFGGFIQTLKQNPKRAQLMKVLGKYEYAPEVLYGLYKNKAFDTKPFEDQIEEAIKLNADIKRQKAAVTKAESVSEAKSSKTANAGKASSFEEYLRRKHKISG